MRARRLVVTASWFLCASARADEVPELMSQPPPLPAGVDAAAAWKLDLAGALQLAVKNNLGLVLERDNVDIASLGITVAGAPFEPTLAAGYLHSSALEAPILAEDGVPGQFFRAREDDWQVSLAQRLESGTLLQLSLSNGRTASELGTAVAPLDYRTNVSLSVTQPLLHGFSLDLTIPKLPLLRARIASERERDQLAVAALRVVEATEDAYWDVVQALYRHDLELKSQARAQDQLALTQRQIAAGTLPPSDLTAVQSTVAQHELGVLQSEQTIEQAWDALRGTLNLPREDYARAILPIDLPAVTGEAPTDEAALAIALKTRPDLAQLDLDVQSRGLDVRAAENDKLPQLDLGVTGSVLGEDPSYGHTLDQAVTADGHAWQVTLNFTWTPLMRATRAAAVISHRQQHQAVVTRDQLVQQIWLDVRDAVRNLRSAAQLVTASAQARALAAQTLEIEQRRFLNGTSSNINVAIKQDELSNAQVSELAAVLQHEKATAALLRATGQLLDERRISLQ